VLYILGCSRYEGDNFVLDQQVVRAALKSYRHLFSTKAPSTSSLSPSSYYLRLLLEPSNSPSELADSSWEDPATSILLLEWRAAAIVHELTQNLSDPDASVIQRVSKPSWRLTSLSKSAILLAIWPCHIMRRTSFMGCIGWSVTPG